MTSETVRESTGTAISFAVGPGVGRSIGDHGIDGADPTIGTGWYAKTLTARLDPGALSVTVTAVGERQS